MYFLVLTTNTCGILWKEDSSNFSKNIAAIWESVSNSQNPETFEVSSIKLETTECIGILLAESEIHSLSQKITHAFKPHIKITLSSLKNKGPD